MRALSSQCGDTDDRVFDLEDPSTWDAFTDEEIWADLLNPDHERPSVTLPDFYEHIMPFGSDRHWPLAWFDDREFRLYEIPAPQGATGYVALNRDHARKLRSRTDRRFRAKVAAMIGHAGGVLSKPQYVQAVGIRSPTTFAAIGAVSGPLKRLLVAAKFVPSQPRELWLTTIYPCGDDTLRKLIKSGKCIAVAVPSASSLLSRRE